MGYSNIILTKVLSMDDAQLQQFIKTLSPDIRDYLEVLLLKAENNTLQLKKYLDSK